MTVEVRPDLVTSLGVIRGDVVHHLAGVSRYRALRNLEQTMTDIAEFQDLVMPLRDVREQIERQLQETREYRALCAIDSIVPQLVDVLAFLDEKSNADVPSPNTDEPVTAVLGPETDFETQIRVVDAREDEPVAESVIKFADSVRVVSETQGVVASSEIGDAEHSAVQTEDIPEPLDSSLAVARDAKPDDTAFGPSQIPITTDGNPPASDDSSEETASPPVAMLVQSLPPATNDAKSAPADSQADLATTINSDQAAREGRAA